MVNKQVCEIEVLTKHLVKPDAVRLSSGDTDKEIISIHKVAKGKIAQLERDDVAESDLLIYQGRKIWKMMTKM